MTLDYLKFVCLPFSFLCLCFDICLQWSCFWHGSKWCCRWICGGSFGISGAKFEKKKQFEDIL